MYTIVSHCIVVNHEKFSLKRKNLIYQQQHMFLQHNYLTIKYRLTIFLPFNEIKEKKWPHVYICMPDRQYGKLDGYFRSSSSAK